MNDFYYARGGVKQGPFSRTQIIDKIKAKEIYLTDLIWSPSLADWTLVSDTEFAPVGYRTPIKNAKTNKVFDRQEFTSAWCYVGNIWLLLLGVLFFFDQVFFVRDNPFASIRAIIFYPWFFFSIVANAFIFWGQSAEKKELQYNLTCTGIIMLCTIWGVLTAQVCWGVVGEIRERQEQKEMSKNMQQFKRNLKHMDALWGD